ncbi:DUF2510 domain-containing protein [Mycobacterium intracellulare]|uniref:DUF2510 domain-containing protein n=1 Tax=Mycobacterium intracellulare TaxID=1767 RepID=UPI0018E0B148|nr:DUF2510 domain-containing protein [Mycobacterium intracellulare]
MTTPAQPGWYDDPEDSDAQRYWDGRDWTPHRQRKSHRPPSYLPTPPPLPVGQPYGRPPLYPASPPGQVGANHAKVITFVTIGVLAIVLLVLVAVFAVRNHAVSKAGDSHRSTVPHSNSDQWFAALCRPGSMRTDQGTRLPNAVSGGFCVSSVDGLAIDFGQYNSEYAARNDGRGQFANGSYAIIKDTDGWMIFRDVNDSTGASLQPLAQYGFTITSGHG